MKNEIVGFVVTALAVTAGLILATWLINKLMTTSAGKTAAKK